MTGLEDADRLRVSMTVTEIESVRAVLQCLEETGARVHPGEVAVGGSEESLVEVDVTAITPKQWEALALAFDRGYYRRPREVPLAVLAEELEVSKSAVSQRLGAAEATLVAAVLEVARVDGDGST